MLERRPHTDDYDVIVDGEGEIDTWIDKDAPTPEYVDTSRQNPEAKVGMEHRAKNPAPEEVVELRGERDNPGKHKGEREEDKDHHSNNNKNGKMARENITENVTEDFMEVLTTSGAALGGEMVATELATLVDDSLLSDQSDTIRKTASVGVPLAGAVGTMALTDGQDWAQAASIGMALAGVRNGLQWALPNSSPIDVGENSSADLSGSQSIASGTQNRSRALQGSRQRLQRTATPTSRQRQLTGQSRGVSGSYTSEVDSQMMMSQGDEEMEGIG